MGIVTMGEEAAKGFPRSWRGAEANVFRFNQRAILAWLEPRTQNGPLIVGAPGFEPGTSWSEENIPNSHVFQHKRSGETWRQGSERPEDPLMPPRPPT
jgi:hypothetical protein